MTTTAPDEDELDLIRGTADRIAERCSDSSRVDHTACWKSLLEAGFMELRCPDDDGSPLASVEATSMVVERLARAVCGAPLVGHLLATELLRLAGMPARTEPLTIILDHRWAALSSGPGTAWDASLSEHGVARHSGGVTVLPLATPTETIDPTRPVRRTAGDPAKEGTLTAEAARAFDAFARTLLAVDMLGAASGIFENALDHVRERVQFGVPVGSFQAVQHLGAEAYVRLEGLRSAVMFAQRAIDAGEPKAFAASLVAKSYADEAAIGGVETAIQLFGGIAITAEHRAHLHLRRVLLDREVFGDAATLNDLLLDEEDS